MMMYRQRSVVVRLVFVMSVVLLTGGGFLLAVERGSGAVTASAADVPARSTPAPSSFGSFGDGVTDSPALEAERLLIEAFEEAGGDLRLHQVTASGDADGAHLSVCLIVPLSDLARQGWLGVELIASLVRQALTPLSWRSLSVSALDSTTGACRALSDFAPRADPLAAEKIEPVPDAEAVPVAPPDHDPVSVTAATGGAAQGSLTGKTVYLSAGHGWYWNGWQWRTQRIEYEGFIEDHNNAEVVTQYLMPYLENAGATVISARERDWNGANVTADNDDGVSFYAEAGTWTTSASVGFGGGTYRYAVAVDGTATSTATWTLQAPTTGNHAVYAWFYPSGNRVPDAHYTVHHAGGATTVLLDQTARPKTWRYLGTFPFHAGPVTVTLDNRSQVAAGKAVIADALRLGGGTFDTFDDLQWVATTASTPGAPPDKPWWETSAFYFAQRMGMDLSDAWIPYFNDVIARPLYARWHERSAPSDAVFISWHTNGFNGDARGTVTYVHDGTTYPQTPGSADLQHAVHTELINDIQVGWDATWFDRGKKAANLGEVRMLWDEEHPEARIPGVLLEIAFHDNPEDAAALKEPTFNQLAARAVYQGIVTYFENRDGVDLTLLPEPPTHLRVENVGAGRVRVAWSASPVDDEGLAGDAAAAYHVYTSPDGFSWGEPRLVAGTAMTLTGLADGTTVYVRVTGVNGGGESLPTEVLGATVGVAPLLIVNGFDKLNRFGLVQEYDPVEKENLRMWLAQINSRDYAVHHGEALPAGYAWDSASNEAVSAGLVALSPYRVVDWILGEESLEVDGTLNAAERARLRDYLDAGGSLLVSGTELAWDLAVWDPAFLRDYLHADYVEDDAGTYLVRPVEGRAFEGIGEFFFDASGEYDADYPDVLAPQPGAVTALTYGRASGGAAGIQFADGCRRQLTLGFPLEVVRTDARAALMAAAISFLDHCPNADVTIISPREGGLYTRAPSFTGDASDAAKVEVEVRREIDDLAWTGSTWGSARWLSATGTVTWSYDLPALADGLYRVRARASGSAAAPDEVSFRIDGTAPLTPALITPTTGAVVAAGTSSLRWSAPADSGSSLVYEVELDGAMLPPTVGTSISVNLGVGVHAWRVRAVDAAGNTGPWSPTQSFAAVCVACGSVDTLITSIEPGDMITATPTFQGLAIGNDLKDVQAALVYHGGGDLYWDGAGWLGTETIWLTATSAFTDTGALVWDYGLPDLADGAYTAYARAVGADLDACPAQVTFWVDGTPPDEPVILGPANTATVKGISVVLTWSAPDDEEGGTALHYDVAVDDAVYTTSKTELALRLRVGSHQWRVRAKDAAGNVGAWSAWQAFELDAHQVFLPLVTVQE